MFKNLIVYRIAPSWDASLTALEQALATRRFVPCGPGQEQALGWVEPRGEAHGPLAESVGGQWVLRLMSETRVLPASVVNRAAQEQAAQIEATTGRKVGRKELRDLKEQARQALLPQAFTRQSSAWVWIDPLARRLVIDSASQSRADGVVTELVRAIDGMGLELLPTAQTPAGCMAAWLADGEPPAGFAIDRECELKATDGSQAVVRYARHPLDTDEVRQHIAQGKQPTRLALTWGGRVSLVLTEGLQIKKLAFLEGVFAGREAQAEEGFDTDVAIATGELRQLLPQLLEALGGENLPV
ncbi:MAG: recombination-associated protein RdgC [Burkholderiaceae bacterium]|nr:recombination-associated protein RdgC [Burkholderiaceae bacterium]